MNEFQKYYRMAQAYRKTHPPGTRIVLLGTSETMQPVPIGTRGTISHIDDQCGIHMHWDNGRSLSVIPGEDVFRKLTPKELAEEQGGELCNLGDDCKIIVPKETIDCSRLGFFDELEEKCWQLVKDYCNALNIKIIAEDGEIPISFNIAKDIQDSILGKLQEAGVKFDFDGHSQELTINM